MSAPSTSTSPFLSSIEQKSRELLYWEKPAQSACVASVGLLWFWLIGYCGYPSTTVLCYCMMFQLIARLVYRNGIHILSGLNMIEKRPALVTAPETFVTEEEVVQYLKASTGLINAFLHAAYVLIVADSTPFVLKSLAGFWIFAMASKLLGSTGMCFLSFVVAFTCPKVYQLYQPQIDEASGKVSASVLAQVNSVASKARQASKELMEKLPVIPKATDLKPDASTKPKAL